MTNTPDDKNATSVDVCATDARNETASNVTVSASMPTHPLDIGGEDANATNNCQLKHCDAYHFVVTLQKDAFGLGIYFAEAPDGCAIVDNELPFYRLPNDGIAPGEASGVIAPGDVLCAIDGCSLAEKRFAAVVELLRCIPVGAVTLAFERQMPRLVVVSSETQQRDSNCNETVRLATETEPNENDAFKPDESRTAPRWRVLERLSSLTTTTSTNSNEASAIAALQATVYELETALHAAEAALERERKCRFLAEKKNILYRNELVRRSDEIATLRCHVARERSEQHQRDAFTHKHLYLAI